MRIDSGKGLAIHTDCSSTFHHKHQLQIVPVVQQIVDIAESHASDDTITLKQLEL